MKFTKNNRRLNHCDVDGVFTMQHHCILSALNQITDKPNRVFEIGTNQGGFTNLLHNVFNDINIITIDIKDIVKVKNKKTYYIIGDCFKDEFFIDSIKEFSGRKFIFCDGGNKEKEFNTFVKYLNTGDVIFLHDYIVDEDTFEKDFKGKIWNWHESRYLNIKDSVKRYNLTPYMPDVFQPVAWGSFIKI
jgi:hypothetical protein